jgi:hypothetical protein
MTDMHRLQVAIVAACLVGTRIQMVSDDGGRTHRMTGPSKETLESAVETAIRLIRIVEEKAGSLS